ncbi:MAG: HlyD family efflux transporter periplasmic adaptor subunit [Methyloprofundus sp.]|nr:HlyD family efflux transporter periplasmic adaptor subunit [Methyloprofundus sp.]
MEKKKYLVYLILIVLLTLILFVAFRAKPIPVDSVLAQYAPMKISIEEEGKTRVVDHFVITAPSDAYMQRINFNEGDKIDKGQTLLALEPLPSSILDLRSRVRAEATLGATIELEKIIQQMNKAAKADKELADIILQRNTQLRKKKVISENELDISKAEKQRADAVYQAFQFGRVFTQYVTQMSRAALDYEDIRQSVTKHRIFKVKSITSGKILKISDKSERAVKMGAVLMEMGDIEHIEVETDVLSTLAVKLAAGMPVEILRWGGGQALQGKVRRIESSGFTKISALGVEEQRVKVIIGISTPYNSRQQLGHGFRVESRFILWSSDKVLQIPNSALFRDKGVAPASIQDNWAVYVIKSNELQKRLVKIGHQNSLMAEVIAGLVEGEPVVSYLSNELETGVRIEVR